MKHFVLLSILIMSSLFVASQDACDSLMIFLDDQLVLSSDTVLCLNKNPQKLMGSINNENFTVSVFLDTEDRKEAFTILEENATYSIGVFDEDTDMLICTKTLAVSVTKPSGISFKNAENITLADSFNVCVQETYYIIPNFIDTSNLICQWKLNDEIFSDHCTLAFNNNDASVSKLKLSIEDTLGCIVNFDSLTLNAVSPPTFTSLTPTNALSCNLDGMISFEVNNPSADFNVNYIFNNRTPVPINSLTNVASFPVAIGSYTLEILYGQPPGCSTNTVFSIISPDALSVEFNLLKTGYCVGNMLFVYIDKNDAITSKIWYLNDNVQNSFSGKDTLNIELSDSFGENLEIRLNYTYNNTSNITCASMVEESISVYPKPKPQITASHTSSICQSEILELSVDTVYSNYVWTVNNEIQKEDTTSVISITDLEAGQSSYSIQVKDVNECLSDIVASGITVTEGVDVIFPNEVMQNDTLCNGMKVLYANSSNLTVNTTANRLFRNSDFRFSIVEWNTDGTFSNTTSCGTITTAVTELIVPNGRIERFGSSETLVFADTDNSADRLTYQWFYIDLNEDADPVHNSIPNATERIIDCLNFDCLFAFRDENLNKVLGLEIYNDRNGCTNLIFYDIHDLFPGLKDIPVSVSDISFNNIFTLHPNPNQGSFYIHLSTPQTNQFNIDIFNTLGELIWADQLSNQTTQKIDLPNIEAGMYFVVLKSNDAVLAQQKFIVP